MQAQYIMALLHPQHQSPQWEKIRFYRNIFLV